MVQTREVLTWRMHGEIVDMPKGTKLDLLFPNDAERERLKLFVKPERMIKTPHVVCDVMGARRYVPVEALDTEAAKLLRAARRTGS